MSCDSLNVGEEKQLNKRLSGLNGNTSNKHHNINESVERLYKGYTPRSKYVVRDSDEEKSALITELPEDTIRWLKRRRNPRSKCPVPISHYREKQLRAMFEGLDFENKGYIELEVLKDVIRYINASSKQHTPKRHLQTVFKPDEISMKEIEKVFSDMDIDGDGRVDYQEFTHAMAGNSSSAIDKASDHEIEKLYAKFTQFSALKKRDYALAGIQTSIAVPVGMMRHDSRHDNRSQNTNFPSLHRMGTAAMSQRSLTQQQTKHHQHDDYQNCKYFRILLGLNDQLDYESLVSMNKELQENYTKRHDADKYSKAEDLLSDMIRSNVEMKIQAGVEISPHDIAYQKIQERCRKEREDQHRRTRADAKLRAIQDRVDTIARVRQITKLKEEKWSKVFVPVCKLPSVNMQPKLKGKRLLELKQSAQQDVLTIRATRPTTK